MTSNALTRRSMLAIPLAAFGTARAAEPVARKAIYNHFTDQEEVEFGATFGDKLEKDLVMIQHPKVQAYADALLARIVSTCRRTQIPYRIRVVNDDEFNAFAIPGGRVYLNRGLLVDARSEAELAAVLSHEVGHVVGRHGANKAARIAMAQSLFGDLKKALGVDRTTVGKIIDLMGGPPLILAELKYSRNDETEADLLGFYNLQRAGWNPQAMISMLNHLGEGGPAPSRIRQVLHTHPEPAFRAGRVRQELAQLPAAGRNGPDDHLGQLAEIQALVRPMPAPPKKRKGTSASGQQFRNNTRTGFRFARIEERRG